MSTDTRTIEQEFLKAIDKADRAGIPRIRLADACQVSLQAIARWQSGYFPHEIVMRTVIDQAALLETAPAGAPSEQDVADAALEAWCATTSWNGVARAVLALLKEHQK